MADNLAQHDSEAARREVNALQKEIGTIKKAKGDASELLAKKAEIDKRIADLTARAKELEKKRDTLAGRIGNIVDPTCHVSLTEVRLALWSLEGISAEEGWRWRRARQREADVKDDNPIKHVWHPEPNHKGNAPPGLQTEDKGVDIISHHEVLARLEAYDTDRGASRFRSKCRGIDMGWGTRRKRSGFVDRNVAGLEV